MTPEYITFSELDRNQSIKRAEEERRRVREAAREMQRRTEEDALHRGLVALYGVFAGGIGFWAVLLAVSGVWAVALVFAALSAVCGVMAYGHKKPLPMQRTSKAARPAGTADQITLVLYQF